MSFQHSETGKFSLSLALGDQGPCQYEALLTSGDSDGGCYELYTPVGVNSEPIRGIDTGLHSSVFIGNGRFAVLQNRGKGKVAASVFDIHNSPLGSVSLPYRTHAITLLRRLEFCYASTIQELPRLAFPPDLSLKGFIFMVLSLRFGLLV